MCDTRYFLPLSRDLTLNGIDTVIIAVIVENIIRNVLKDQRDRLFNRNLEKLTPFPDAKLAKNLIRKLLSNTSML